MRPREKIKTRTNLDTVLQRLELCVARGHGGPRLVDLRLQARQLCRRSFPAGCRQRRHCGRVLGPQRGERAGVLVAGSGQLDRDLCVRVLGSSTGKPRIKIQVQ